MSEISVPREKGCDLREFFEYCYSHPVDPVIRLLLTSDGSITTLLRALSLSPIHLRVKNQGEVLLANGLAECLEASPDERAFRREVWLTNGEQWLLFASSLFPLSQMTPAFYQEIQGRDKPLGLLLEERRLPTLRDRIRIFRLYGRDLPSDLQVSGEEQLWARQYRLTVQGEARASIFEIFSPKISYASF